MKCKKRKSIVLWADDDWANYSMKEIANGFISSLAKDFGYVFHHKKENAYEGEPRKVRITIEEI